MLKTWAGWPTQSRVTSPMACVITVAGFQAGSGKTTIAVNLAASFVLEGHSCMLIDLAASADASRTLGVNVTSGALAASAVLTGLASLKAVRLPTASGIDLVAGHPDIALVVNSAHFSGKLLQDQLRSVAPDYRYILLDCPPSLNPVEAAALAAGDKVVVAYSIAQALGRPTPLLPRLQLAFIRGSLSIVLNKVLPGDGAKPGAEQDDRHMPARLLGTIRYTADLGEMYWRGIPPVMRYPRDTFVEDVLTLARTVGAS